MYNKSNKLINLHVHGHYHVYPSDLSVKDYNFLTPLVLNYKK